MYCYGANSQSQNPSTLKTRNTFNATAAAPTISANMMRATKVDREPPQARNAALIAKRARRIPLQKVLKQGEVHLKLKRMGEKIACEGAACIQCSNRSSFPPGSAELRECLNYKRWLFIIRNFAKSLNKLRNGFWNVTSNTRNIRTPQTFKYFEKKKKSFD